MTHPRITRLLGAITVLASMLLGRAAFAAVDCGDDVVEQLFAAPKTAGDNAVHVHCDLTIPSDVHPGEKVLKRIIVDGNAAWGITIDCNGRIINGGPDSYNYKHTMLDIHSKPPADPVRDTWGDRPGNVTIRRCNIVGTVRIYGMGFNANQPFVKEASYLPGYVAQVQNSAPYRITLDRVHITGDPYTPLYVGPGVSDLTVVDSIIDGKSNAAGVYLEAETVRNVFRNDKIWVDTNGAPEMAIDGSSDNRIIGNTFGALRNGGIYLYRNCGQSGSIRHNTPINNQIISNVFLYDKYTGPNPAVFLGSRNGTAGYCDADRAGTTGSAVDDRSFARYNTVMGNQIVKRSLSEMIFEGYSVNQPNYIGHNETVSAPVDRPAGCWIWNGYGTDFLQDGESIDVFRGNNGVPVCPGYRYTCQDGESTAAFGTTCAIDRAAFDCRVTGNNHGCTRTASCPYASSRLIGAVAACNLESGAVTDGQLASVPTNDVKVVRASDNVYDGRCSVGATFLSYGQQAITGLGSTSTTVSCKEHDGNGGDCDVRGALYCRRSVFIFPAATVGW